MLFFQSKFQCKRKKSYEGENFREHYLNLIILHCAIQKKFFWFEIYRPINIILNWIQTNLNPKIHSYFPGLLCSLLFNWTEILLKWLPSVIEKLIKLFKKLKKREIQNRSNCAVRDARGSPIFYSELIAHSLWKELMILIKKLSSAKYQLNEKIQTREKNLLVQCFN